MNNDLLDALQYLNQRYGQGTITAYRLDPWVGGPLTGVAYRRYPKVRGVASCRFTLQDATLHFLRHQRKLPT